MIDRIQKQAESAVRELLEVSKLRPGDLLVIGCSSSEIMGERIGKGSSMEAAQAVYDGIAPVLEQQGILLAVQCCEHLNRALITDRETMEKYGLEQVNVIPQPKAGGSFATTFYKDLKEPVAVENLKAGADAGIDIGGVLIGMHIKPVVVPLKITNKKIGEAIVIAARRRPKFVGGVRAVYDENLE
jgi:uncharacterized protein (TIGR01440 family)